MSGGDKVQPFVNDQRMRSGNSKARSLDTDAALLQGTLLRAPRRRDLHARLDITVAIAAIAAGRRADAGRQVFSRRSDDSVVAMLQRLEDSLALRCLQKCRRSRSRHNDAGRRDPVEERN